MKHAVYQIENKNIIIFSDSLSVLQSLNSTKIDIKTNEYIYNIKKLYNTFIQQNGNRLSLSLFWIPSHLGVRGNEEVDKLAKEASNFDLPNVNAIPFTDMYDHFKRNAFVNTQNSIKEIGQSNGKLYFELYYKQCKRPWYDKKCLTREFIVTINRIRANHYNLTASLSRVNIINCKKCRCGNDQEDINHVLWQCEVTD